MNAYAVNQTGARPADADSTGRARLSVLPEVTDLRERGPLVDPTSWPVTPAEDVPRTLRGLARIVDGGLCHRCGSCIGICPTGVLGVDEEEYPTVVSLSSCTDCELCVKVCPGEEFDLHAATLEKFGRPADLKSTHGHFLQGVLAYSNDPGIRERSTSGGLVTALLLHMLESGAIDGAVVIASDEKTIWKGKPIVARTREELLQAMKSKYAIAPTNTMLTEIKNTPGKYALVGLPCQIHGFVKAAELDARLKERVVLTVGLFCHAAIEHEAFRVIWDTLPKEKDTATRFTSRIGKHPGTPHLTMADGSLYPVYFGDKKGYRPSSMELINIIYRLYTPERCMTCFDATAELADIAVGDPWMAPPADNVDFHKGWSFALVRSERGRQAYESLVSSGTLSSMQVTEREAVSCNHHMSTEKRWRAFRVIETHRRQGKPIPKYGDYHMRLPAQSGSQFVKTELHMFTHLFCFVPKMRAAVLRFILSDGGYSLLWLNRKRRDFRFWRRDTLAMLRRKLFGRK